jgi:hypothetical protein
MGQTPIDWFLDNIPIRYKNALLNDCKEEIEKSRKMQKEQIVDSYNVGTVNGLNYPESQYPLTGDQYFDEIYGTKNNNNV